MGDSGADAAVLADVLAFLDQFEVDDRPEPAQRAPEASSPAPQSAAEPSASPQKRRKPREPNAQARNRARLALYRRKKQELQALRGEVEGLARRLDILRRCGASELEARAADALSVTIRRARIDWRRVAERERALRAQAEQSNADLRRLVEMQQQWASDVGGQLQFWQGGGVQRSVLDATPPPDPVFQPPSIGSSVIRALFDKAYRASELDPLSALKNFDWADAAAHMHPSIKWSTSFQVPVADPDTVGMAWWQAIQNADNLQGLRTDEITMERKDQREIIKKAVWSVSNCTSDEIRFVGLISFQLKTEPGVRCVLSARGDVFDSTGTSLLFRTSAVRAITPSRATSTPSCIFRGQYSVFDTGISEFLRSGEAARMKEHAEVGISAWREKMRLKDQHMRLRFVGL